MSATSPPTPSTPPSQAPGTPVASDLMPGGTPTGPQPPAGGGDQGPPPPTPSGRGGDDGWTPPPVPERSRSWVTRATLGAALVVVGIMWTLHLADVVALGAGEMFAIALLVVGVGLLVGTFVGRARWLILAGALLIPPVLAAQIAVPGPFTWDFEGGAGEVRVTAETLDELDDSYSLGAGSIRIDLTEMDFAGETVELDLSVGAGELHVIVPDDVEVEVNASSGIGQVSLLDEGRRGGVGPRSMSATASPDDAQGRLELEMSAGIGEIEVTSAPASR